MFGDLKLLPRRIVINVIRLLTGQSTIGSERTLLHDLAQMSEISINVTALIGSFNACDEIGHAIPHSYSQG